ncbi:serine/threonine protein kinase [Paenibacillus sp. GCM10028914]|uniref:serine/threonine protein kinase n=1 Tax=Paenibacillus sp. GCM10028914 TaxID=3273416 RepID=UPI0036D3744E
MRVKGADNGMIPEKDGPYLETKTVLGSRYRVHRPIAQSELSVVYTGRYLTGEAVIIKEFYPRALVLRDLDRKTVLCRKPSVHDKFAKLREAFEREAHILKSLKHPSIVRCYEHFEENGTYYTVLEYCRGRSLERVLRKRKPDVELFLSKTALPLISGIQHLHREGWIHRDIKPANIMILSDGGIKLIDFGSAVALEREEERGIVTSAHYSPLELYSKDSRQGTFSDVYSLCATLYASLAGKPPADIRERLINDSLIPLQEHAPAISAFLAGRIQAGLSIDRKRPTLAMLKAAVHIERYRVSRRQKSITAKV